MGTERIKDIFREALSDLTHEQLVALTVEPFGDLREDMVRRGVAGS